jgi:hypothetical protein
MPQTKPRVEGRLLQLLWYSGTLRCHALAATLNALPAGSEWAQFPSLGAGAVVAEQAHPDAVGLTAPITYADSIA